MCDLISMQIMTRCSCHTEYYVILIYFYILFIRVTMLKLNDVSFVGTNDKTTK